MNTADWILAVFAIVTLALIVVRIFFTGQYERWIDLENEWLRRVGLHSEKGAERSKRFEKSRLFLLLMVLGLLAATGLWSLQAYFRESRDITIGIAPATTRVGGEGATRTIAPLRSVLPTPIVDVSINGQGPFGFIVDTGAPLTVVSNDLAETLQLKRADGRLPLGEGTSPLWYVEQLEVGAAVFKQFGVASDASTDTKLLTMKELSKRLGHDIQGILGFCIFSGCTVTLDFPDKELWIEPPGILTAGKAHTVRLSDSQRPIIPVQAGWDASWTLQLLVDTGFDGTLLLESTAHDLPVEEGTERLHVKRTFYGEQTYRVAELSVPISIAGHGFQRVLAGFSADEPGEPRDGFIGMGLLEECSLSFDASRGLLQIAR